MAYEQRSPIPVVQGGTGVSTMTTAYAPVCAGTTATGALQVASTGLSTSGFVLTSNGSSSLPSFQVSPGITTVNGNSGSVTGSTITITGGSSGAVFTGSSSTLTESFNYLALPATTSTNGQVTLNGSSFLSSYGGNLSLGINASNFTTTAVGNTAIGQTAMNAVTSGHSNTAVGESALASVTSASNNTAVGYFALTTLTSGTGDHTAVGYQSLNAVNNSATSNTALGYQSGLAITSSDGNTAIGKLALSSLTSGTGNNVAVGYQALDSLGTGKYNTAIGYLAGSNYTGSESSNIIFHSSALLGESNTLRIGNGTGTSDRQLNAAFICGVTGITVTGAAVLISSSNQLGVAASSIRVKENVADMGDVSSKILQLRPVKFNYIVGDDRSQQTGLIAEEVHEIMPSLVVYDQEGLPQTVKYHDLPALLLNELQKVSKELQRALQRIDILESLIKE